MLKPGGHIIAFAATRTIHRLMTNFEDAGFEIRDLLAWLQWQGFPKSMDVSKAIDKAANAERPILRKDSRTAKSSWLGTQDGKSSTWGIGEWEVTGPATPEARRWSGWGTALKPAQEPAVLARKPLDGTVAENVLKWGTGGLNIDGCRYGYGDGAWPGPQGKPEDTDTSWSKGNPGVRYGKLDYNAGGIWAADAVGRWPANIYHCPKPSRSEREKGMGDAPKIGDGSYEFGQDGSLDGRKQPLAANHHPTVKPIRLMRWLVRLVTPPGGVLVEPFGGSGTTLIAAEREGFACVSAELEPKYCDIIRARLSAAVDGE